MLKITIVLLVVVTSSCSSSEGSRSIIDSGRVIDAGAVVDLSRTIDVGIVDSVNVVDSTKIDGAVDNDGGKDLDTGIIDTETIDAQSNACLPYNTCPNNGCCVLGVCVDEGSICPGMTTANSICKYNACGQCGGPGEFVCGNPGYCTAPNTAPIPGGVQCGHCGDLGNPCCEENQCEKGSCKAGVCSNE